MDVLVAAAAGDQGLASSHRHEAHPGRSFGPAGPVEVGEFADVVNLHLTRLLADLTNVREESCDEFLVRIVNPDRLAVGDRAKEAQCISVPWGQ